MYIHAIPVPVSVPVPDSVPHMGSVLLVWCRAAAIQAGAVPALCGILQAGAAHSVPIALDDVLKASAALVSAWFQRMADGCA